jgi:hypothetical protein
MRFWTSNSERKKNKTPFILPADTTEAESKEKHVVWDPMPELTITSPYVHSRVDSNTFSMSIGQPYAKVDLNPLAEWTLSPSQGLWIWPQKESIFDPSVILVYRI